MNVKPLYTSLALASLVCFSSASFAQESDQLPAGFLSTVKPHTMANSDAAGGGALGRRSNGSLLGIDSVVNFSSYFYYPGVIDQFGDAQFTWNYTMVGQSPFDETEKCRRGTTTLSAPIVPVIMDLRNADGTPRFVNGQPLISSPAAYITPTLNSPVFQNYNYDLSYQPTQFVDSVMRAEFYHQADEGWHTLLKPIVKTTRTMVLLRGTYRYALNTNGSCCAYVLVDSNTFVSKLFPPTPTDTTSVMGQAEHAGDIHTTDIATFLFPDTYLYSNNDPNQCCVLGFHSYDLEPGDASNGWRERRYVMNYSSWIASGAFGSAFSDVTALSHEMTETFNDPFANNATPFWLAPNGLCQNNLETGDVIEGLSNATTAITMKGFTYHPQNEALLQWFANQTPSNAIHHAYSYPDTSVLTSGAVSQNYACTPAK